MDRDEPVSASEAAELRVLEIALAERAGRGAPDAWPAIAARLAAGDAAVAPRRRSRLLVAAMTLLGLGVVIATALWQEPPELHVAMQVRGRPTDPQTLEDLRQRIRGADSGNVMAIGSWSDDLHRFVDLERWPLDSLFKSGMSPALPGALRAALVTALDSATVQGATVVRDVVWTHRLNLPRAESIDQSVGAVLLLRVGGGQPVRVAFRSPDGAVELSCPALPLVQLQPLLEKSREATVSELGIAIGPGGFAALPSDARSLRLIDVPERARGELQRFPRLKRLDLRRAPAWHAARVLDGLAEARLRCLLVAPQQLDAGAYAALGRLDGLKELFFLDGDAFGQFVGQSVGAIDVVRAPSLDDAALGALGGLTQLEELALGGGVFGDEGLRRLHTLQLRRLLLVECDGVRGAGFAALGSVDHLLVSGGHLATDVASVLAMMPKLRRLDLVACGALALAPLASSTTLEKLVLRGPLATGRIGELAGLHVAVLELDLTPRPGVEDLRPLAAMNRLKHLTLVGVGEDVCVQLREVLPGCQITRDD